MVDLQLMHSLLKALHDDSQLILVGDPNQLQPIGIGPIWHQLNSKEFKNIFSNNSIKLSKCYRNRGSIAILSDVLLDYGTSQFWKELSILDKSQNIKLYSSKLNYIPYLVITSLKEHFNKIKHFTNNFIINCDNLFEQSLLLQDNHIIKAEYLNEIKGKLF